MVLRRRDTVVTPAARSYSNPCTEIVVFFSSPLDGGTRFGRNVGAVISQKRAQLVGVSGALVGLAVPRGFSQSLQHTLTYTNSHLVKKYPATYETRRFITVFTTARL
jgi:hypothetical protein